MVGSNFALCSGSVKNQWHCWHVDSGLAQREPRKEATHHVPEASESTRVVRLVA